MTQTLGLQGTFPPLRRGVALAAALLLSLGPVPAAFALPAPALSLAAFDAGRQESLRRAGSLLEVAFTPEGRPEQVRGEGAARTRTPLTEEQTRRVLNFLTALDPKDPQLGMSLALRGFLSPRVPAAELEDNMFLKRDAEGNLTMTELGRRALLDILLASDGQLLEPEAPRALPTPLLRADGSEAPATGSLASVGERALSAPNFAALDPSAAFDGAAHRLGTFDWTTLDSAAVPAGGTAAFERPKRLDGYAYDAEKGTLRVMVAANRAVETDRIRSAGDGSAVLAEAGLDKSLFDAYGAKVVRAVDNLVTIDVPLPQAMALGLALKDQGLESRPARLFKAAMGALSSPAASMLGAALLPVPTAAAAAALAALPKLVEARTQVEGEALERAGLRGKGSLVGVIDSGIDPEHADFKDAEGNSRIGAYLDFTGEGTEDVIGHGTHVAGTIGGTGAASGGAYRGMADQTKFKVAKVFGLKGETDESVILAAMKWMAGGEGNGPKVDVLNMSLGGPGDPNVDPLSSMVNRLTVNDKILVVAAAGNEGPWTSSVGSPGNARYALTVGGVNKDGEVAFFSSRGPIMDSEGRELYGKPDVLGVSGDVDLSRVQPAPLVADAGTPAAARAGLASLSAAPALDSCIYAPGVIAPRSSHDPDQACAVAGNPGYRYMSGTSMATPEVAGMAADVIAYLKSQGYEVDPFQVKAVIMETAGALAKESKDVQGAGLVNGNRLAQAVFDRVKRGLPVGNVAFALSMRLTVKDRASLERQTRYKLTPLGLLDTASGRLVRDEAGIDAAIKEIRKAPPTIMVSLPAAEVLPG
jgi:hypothetical protein